MTRRLLAAAALAMTCACGDAPTRVRMVTTTSVDNSGLLEAILPHFEREFGAHVDALAVGSGQAFQIARRGDADLLLTHEPDGERRLFTDGLVTYYRKIMFNRFVIAGPAGDPARIRSARTAAAAMRQIADSGAAFVSRGDDSGTHVREQLLWQAAGVTPGGGRLIETGQGMSSTLRVASERRGYVLTDEATFAQLAGKLALEVLFTEDPALINTYSIAILSTAPADRRDLAGALARWLAEGNAQDAIDAFRVGGRQVFFRWPAGVDPMRPESVPGIAGR